MEAVPRLPMISFDVKTSTEIVSFGSKLKQYISSFYHEDAESYNNEIHNLETLRAAAVRPTIDVSGCQMLKKYYCQLHFLKSRFPMEDGQTCAVYFSWRDNYSNMVCSVPDIDFELMNILYDIGAVHAKLGAEDSRVTPEGMKMACTHFQCAAWAFQTVRETFPQMVSLVLAPEVIHFMHLTCLAQAQECILEKSMMDNRKATIIAKVAVQVVDYYKQALTTLQTSGEEGSLSDLLGSRTYKDWLKYLNFKVAYHKTIALLYQGQQAEEQQKMGERVAFYQAASDQLQEACKRARDLSHQQEIGEALAFTGDVVEGKRKAAKNENEFIYHEDVPDKDALQEMKGASLVKGIAFNVNDVEVSGSDIFARLVPMEAHEASSLYSEQKAQMLRQLGELVENKDRTLAEFMSSMQLDVLTQMRQASGLTQDLVDRAAAMSARPTAIQDLVSAMGKLSNTYHDVEAMLSEIDGHLKEEEKKEQDYQSQMGTRPPSIIATDLTREFTKYQEAHSKASDSNQNLHRAMTTHIANLKILSLPLSQLKQQIPSVEMPNREVDEEVIREMESLLGKVEEMKNQRSLLWAQLHDAVKNDDITGLLVTRPPEKSLDQLFQEELQKHQRQGALIEQNMAAQENILKALIETYARFTNTRRYLQDVISKRSTTLSALVSSYDTYEDLLSKANKGLEFYNKLETNVTKLLQRIKSTCKVQDEEREQILEKHNKKKIIIPPSTGPKLKDYLEPKLKDYIDAKKSDGLSAAISEQIGSSGYAAQSGMVSNMSDQQWPPAVRPAPLGSEMNSDSISSSYGNEQGYYSNYSVAVNPHQVPYNPSYTTAASVVPSTTTSYSANFNYTYGQPYTEKGVEQDLNDRMASLMSNKPGQVEGHEYSQQQVAASQGYGYPTSASNPQVLSNQNAYYQSSESTPKQEQTGATYANALTAASAAAAAAAKLAAPPASYAYQPSNYAYGAAVPQASSNIYNTPQGYNESAATYSSGMQHSNTYAQPTQAPINYSQANSGAYVQPVVPPNSYAQSNSGSYLQSVATPSSYTQANTSSYIQPVPAPNSYIPADSDAYLQSAGVPNSYAQATSNLYTQTVAASAGYADSNVVAQSIPPANAYENTYSQSINQSSPYNTIYSSSNTAIQDGTAYLNSNVYGDNYSAYQQYGTQISSSMPASGYGTSQTYNGTYDMAVGNYYPYSGQATDNTGNYTNYSSISTVSQPVTTTAVSTGYVNYSQGYCANQGVPPISSSTTSCGPVESNKKDQSNIDLLSGLDFTINQAPLIPQQNKTKEVPTAKVVEQPSVNIVKPSSIKTEDKTSGLRDTLSIEKKHSERLPERNSFADPEVVKLFTQEVEKFEKFVDLLTTKTLNGPTSLDVKWKEIQDKQEMELQRKSISVARCYPMKNRFPDILPYDQTRVKLSTMKDDYINASYIKDITPNSPVFIVTQSPMQSTFNEFWAMVWEEQIEIILCLLNDTEIDREIYWPKENDRPLLVGNFSIGLQSATIKEHWTERMISINHLEKRMARTVRHMQFTVWPSSLFPTPAAVVDYVNDVIKDQTALVQPMLIHCSAGIGRSGLLCQLIAAVTEVLINPAILPDLSSIAVKLCSARKNIVRDREHFKFAYYAFLHFLRELCANQVRGKWAIENSPTVSIQPEVPNTPMDDPLSMLDPLWASKKKM